MALVGRLECGADLGALVDQVVEGGQPENARHQLACRHCRAALRELERLWREVRELAREQPAPPTRLVREVIRRIQRSAAAPTLGASLEHLVPRLLQHARLAADRGVTRIADAVVADVVRAATTRVPQARLLGLRSGGLAPSRGWISGDGIAIEVAEGDVRVALRLGVTFGAGLSATADAVRRVVIREVESLTGLRVASVDIAVDDVSVLE